MFNKFYTWLKDAPSFHHRLMARYLQRRGWVVFYLEPQARKCGDVCWLRLYESEQNR
jgi:hypothetical protein